MKTLKRSQMEIMGLALVVILISLGLLFAVRFSALKPTTSGARKAYVKTIKAANMLNTLLKTDTDCAETSITQLIQDCAYTTTRIDCISQDGTSVNSCAYVREVIGNIFTNTFLAWGSTQDDLISQDDFYFQVKKGTQDVIDPPFGNPCPGVKESKNQPIPIPGGIVSVTLELCE